MYTSLSYVLNLFWQLFCFPEQCKKKKIMELNNNKEFKCNVQHKRLSEKVYVQALANIPNTKCLAY